MKKAFLLLLFFFSLLGFAQVTKSSILGTVKSNKGETLPGATVEVKHVPTGTKYFANTDANGVYSIPSIRPGGPFTVTVSFVGYKPSTITEIFAPLGNNVTVNVKMEDETNALQEVVVTKSSSAIFSKGRTGASQQFSNREINAVPITGSRSITSITKYNANAGANGSFGGQDARLNNFTIDGSVFNNGFGLGNEAQAGGRTGSTAISLDAIEQLQVNIAPFDVRQSGFVGSGINAVTRSGTNEIEGSVYTTFRENTKNFLGTKAGNINLTPANLTEKVSGIRIGAPIIKDKLFIFANAEIIDNISPATNFTANGSANPGAQVALPSVTDLNAISGALAKFGYETGPFENYDKVIESKKFLTRLDWNINQNHNFSLRYVFHNSSSDIGISNSYTSRTAYGPRTGANSISYKNSGYVIKDNTRSIVAELTSKLSDRWNNNFTAGYDIQIEDRALQGGSSFPTIDILNSQNPAIVYITAGLDPFTPGNKLDYNTLHFTNDVTAKFGKHTFLFGANYERFVSNNLFFPGSNANYTFKDVNTFLAAANESSILSGAPGVVAANLPSAFQYRYSALSGGAEPLQILKSNKIDLYIQDEYKVWENLKLTFGLRASRTSFEDTALENPVITPLTFANGEKFNTGDMADAQILFEPRVGFNLDLKNDGKTQIRGGSGVFTGRPPFVFLSNAIGNNGVLTGFIDATTPAQILQGNGTVANPSLAFGFTPNPGQYFTPGVAAPPVQYDLAFTDKNFKFPQVWKTNIAVDQKLPFGFIGTIESIYGKNINAINYYDANLDSASGTFTGTDARPFYSGGNGVRVNNNVQQAVVLTNTNAGYFYSSTFKLEYPYKKGLWGSLAYTYSKGTDLMSAGSIAATSYRGARSITSNNNLSLANSNNNTPHRIVGVLGYKFEYGKEIGAATSINLGYIGEQSGNQSYSYAGDMNGDGVTFNDLLYIPNSATELKFQDISQTIGAVNGQGGSTLVLYTAAEQQVAFDKFIDQDPYLSTRRGKYAERNGLTLPMLHRLDLSVTQDFYIKIKGKKNTFQFRADIINFTNMLNKNWGVSQRFTSPNPLIARGNTSIPIGSNVAVPGTNIPQYQLQFQTDPDGTRGLISDSFQNQASTFDVWSAQFTLRYIFGK